MRCRGCWLSSWITSPSMLCIRSVVVGFLYMDICPAVSVLRWLMALFLDNISQHALHSQWLLAFFMDISPSSRCVVVVVGSLLGYHLPPSSMLCIGSGCWLSSWTSLPGGSALWWLFALFLGPHFSTCFALAVVVGFLHGHLSQKALHR